MRSDLAGMGEIAHLRPATAHDDPVEDLRPDPQGGLLVEGQTALDDSDWASAQACFEHALGRAETAEALDGLAQALFWQGD